jgi:hypothetical protein
MCSRGQQHHNYTQHSSGAVPEEHIPVHLPVASCDSRAASMAVADAAARLQRTYRLPTPDGQEGVASTLAVVKGNRSSCHDDEDEAAAAMLMLRTGVQHRAGRLSMLHMAFNQESSEASAFHPATWLSTKRKSSNAQW